MADEYYRLGRNILGSNRLTMQHYLWKANLGWNIHPWIRKNLEQQQQSSSKCSPLKVADIATGNGIWMMDESLSHAPSTLSFSGFDISPTQFPPQGSYPSHISFSLLDFNHPIPPSLHNAFDLVHVRHIMVAIQNGNPKPVLANLLQMLKPGGFLQWNELDCRNPFTHPPDASSATFYSDCPTRLMRMIPGGQNHSDDWVLRMPALLEDAGLDEIQELRSGPPRDGFWRFFSDQYISGLREMGLRVEAGQDFFGHLDRDRESGVCVHNQAVIVVGRK